MQTKALLALSLLVLVPVVLFASDTTIKNMKVEELAMHKIRLTVDYTLADGKENVMITAVPLKSTKDGLKMLKKAFKVKPCKAEAGEHQGVIGLLLNTPGPVKTDLVRIFMLEKGNTEPIYKKDFDLKRQWKHEGTVKQRVGDGLDYTDTLLAQAEDLCKNQGNEEAKLKKAQQLQRQARMAQRRGKTALAKRQTGKARVLTRQVIRANGGECEEVMEEEVAEEPAPEAVEAPESEPKSEADDEEYEDIIIDEEW